MLAEKYIPKGTNGYKNLSRFFKNFDKIFTLKPLRWFPLWTVLVAGNNITEHLNDRWFYWNWSSFNLYLLFLLVLIPYVDNRLKSRFDFASQLSSITDYLKCVVYSSIIMLLGSNPLSISLATLIHSVPYVLFFLAGVLTWSINIDQENGEKFYKKDIYKLLIIVVALSLLASFLGFSNDDPMISTVAAVYIPFPLVALVFPAAIRHLQRSRSYVVFIPAMFLSMRFPWFLFLIVPLFVLSRHYFYFTSGKIYPTFKVDTPEEVSS
ncbi:MAG: hypothetical protein VW833_00970 [Candidatus Neomarinimicrobiota bacterium]